MRSCSATMGTGCAGLAAFSLAGCISSTAPILSDAKPILGDRGQIHLFNTSQGAAYDHTVATFQWSGGHYRLKGADLLDVTVHAYEGRDLIVQSTGGRPPRRVEYGLARKLTDGVYQIIPISEDDVDDATREKFCTKTQNGSCSITTPEQLFVFARATADKVVESGSVAVVVPSARP